MTQTKPQAQFSNKITREINQHVITSKKSKAGQTQYDALGEVTTIVADTGEVDKMKIFMPTDATTNPSLIFKASKLPEYASLVDAAVKYGKEHGKGNEKETLALVLDKLSVAFGTEITK